MYNYAEDASEAGQMTVQERLDLAREGAIASALNAISRLAKPELKLPHHQSLSDTRMMVQGL